MYSSQEENAEREQGNYRTVTAVRRCARAQSRENETILWVLLLLVNPFSVLQRVSIDHFSSHFEGSFRS